MTDETKKTNTNKQEKKTHTHNEHVKNVDDAHHQHLSHIIKS